MSNGTNGAERRAASAARYSSKSVFHPAACSSAVRVMTPPRSKRNASNADRSMIIVVTVHGTRCIVPPRESGPSFEASTVSEEHMTSAHGTHAPHEPAPTGRTGSPAHHGAPDGHADHGAHAQHDRHADHSVEMFRRKFWGTLLLSIPTVVWSPMVQHWLGYEAWGGATASRVIPAVFGALVFAYGGGGGGRGALGGPAGRPAPRVAPTAPA